MQNVHSVNLADNTGLADLSAAVQQTLRTLPHVGKEPIPKKWVKIRKDLEDNPQNHISNEDYLQICKKYGINDQARAGYISEFLHDLGVILHFQKDRILRNTVILNTRWATEAVYLILFDKYIKIGTKEHLRDSLGESYALHITCFVIGYKFTNLVHSCAY